MRKSEARDGQTDRRTDGETDADRLTDGHRVQRLMQSPREGCIHVHVISKSCMIFTGTLLSFASDTDI